MAQRNVEWYSVDTYGVALCVRSLADLFDILVFLVVTAAKAISPKPPKIQTVNGTAICWGYDVIECENCREEITGRSRCIE